MRDAWKQGVFGIHWIDIGVGVFAIAALLGSGFWFIAVGMLASASIARRILRGEFMSIDGGATAPRELRGEGKCGGSL